MADIFVSYTSQDRDWAFWIGQQLESLGHVARVHEWEISGGGDIFAWMEEHHDKAAHVLCVMSSSYLKAPYSALERRAAQWAAITQRPNFVLPVYIEPCTAPTLLGLIKRCDLHGLCEEEAEAQLVEYLKPAVRPPGPVPFPGARKAASSGAFSPQTPIVFPGKTATQGDPARPIISNIPITVPRHFLGRDDDLAAIDAALKRGDGRAAVTALHGLRGVGKTALAAAYAERHQHDYRATWWIRAETDATMRADLVGLGVQLKWIGEDTPEETAVKAVLDRLPREGRDILLVYDNARSSRELASFLPRGAGPRIIITSNAPDWRGVALPVPIKVWPEEVGADFLVARTGRETERAAGVALSAALGGLPLAHEQAAAYCERLGMSLSDYADKFASTPGRYLDADRAAPEQYHNGLTVSKTFALAIDEAAKLNEAAEVLITYASFLVPEPIPLFLFAEGREAFGEAFASALAGDGLDEAVGALRAFALVDRESIPDERDSSIATDCLRLHRLVREVAAARTAPDRCTEIYRELIAATASVYPDGVHRNPVTWPRARRLDAIALALVGESRDLPVGSEISAAELLSGLDSYRDGALAAYAEAQKLSERALSIREKVRGPDHPDTASSLNSLGYLLKAQGDLAGAWSCYERALAIREKSLGLDHPDTANSLNNLGFLRQEQGDLAGARSHYERALAICEKLPDPDRSDAASCLNNLGHLLQQQGDLAGARSYYERALAIRERSLPSDHLDTALSLNNLGHLLQRQGDLGQARVYYERALGIYENKLGIAHQDALIVARNLAALFDELKLRKEAMALRIKFGVQRR